MNTIRRALALRIDELLKEKDMTRYRLAVISGVSHSTLKNICSGNIRSCMLSTTMKIAHGFGLTVKEFFNSPLFSEENLDI